MQKDYQACNYHLFIEDGSFRFQRHKNLDRLNSNDPNIGERIMHDYISVSE